MTASNGTAAAAAPDATAALALELQQAVAGEVDASDAAFPVDEACCMRYLRARDGDLKKATAMLRATLKWRREFGVRTLVEDRFPVLEKECATGKTFVLPGEDREGRAILVMRNKNENTKDHDGNVAHLVYQMERSVKAATQKRKETWCLVIDFEGYSVFNAPPMRTSRATLSIMQDHYPERLHRAYLVDAPWLFHGFFKLISPFIDPVTKRKIVFVKGDAARRASVLARDFDLANLEKCVGGTSDYAYDAAAYLAADRDRYEKSKTP